MHTADRRLSYLQRYLVEELVEEYREERLGRRELIRRVLQITGSVPATAALLLQMGCGGSVSATTTAGETSATGQRVGTANTGAAATSATATAALPAASSLAGGAASGTAQSSGQSTTATGAAGSTSTGTAGTALGGTTGATSAPAALSVRPDDPAVDAAVVQFPGQAGTLRGYRGMPKGASKAPAIVVVHENRGLTPHIQDVVRRYAKAGFLAVAVDLLSRSGGTEAVPESQVTAALGQAKQADLVGDLLGGVAYLKGLPAFAGPRVGVVGYCFGGGLTWLLAINSPDVAAAVPYYGPPPQPLDDVQKITGAVLAFYGEADTRITSNVPAIQAAMQRYGKTFEYKIYPGAGHAFNNDTAPSYNAAAAVDAFPRSVAWLQRYLQG